MCHFRLLTLSCIHVKRARVPIVTFDYTGIKFDMSFYWDSGVDGTLNDSRFDSILTDFQVNGIASISWLTRITTCDTRN